MNNKYEVYKVLEKKILNCKRCPLHTKRKNAVPGEGALNTKIMIVGEAPGGEEDIEGVPFCGRAGQLLTKILASIDIARKDIFITNILKCRPPNNRNPLPAEITMCTPYLNEQINIIKPSLIIALGNFAARYFLKIKNAGISKLRGKFYKIEFADIKDLIIFPMFHPSYLLRNIGKYKGSPKYLTYLDILKVKKIISSL